MEYHYTECGLDNVILTGAQFVTEKDGEEIVTIPNINGLHRVIAKALVEKDGSLTGKEIRFLRTEMGLTQAQLAVIVHRSSVEISRWECGSHPIDSNGEALIRLVAREILDLDSKASVTKVSSWCVARAATARIAIDGRDPANYRMAA
jgi:DNA-binding transcriptional regulator YiaG